VMEATRLLYMTKAQLTDQGDVSRNKVDKTSAIFNLIAGLVYQSKNNTVKYVWTLLRMMPISFFRCAVCTPIYGYFVMYSILDSAESFVYASLVLTRALWLICRISVVEKHLRGYTKQDLAQCLDQYSVMTCSNHQHYDGAGFGMTCSFAFYYHRLHEWACCI